jgi:RNA polymerase sigma-70 factor, ECF subfamily
VDLRTGDQAGGGRWATEIVAWRHARLRKAGFDIKLAEQLSLQFAVGLHVLRATPSVSLAPGMSSRLPISAAASEPDRAQADSHEWLAALRRPGTERDEAIGRLHELLVRAARFEVSRRRAALSHVRGEELDDLALQAADDALVAVLGKLDDYRGASRFTTWAYKFALLEAAVKVRKRAWQGRELPLEPETWELFRGSDGSSPEAAAEQGELFGELGTAIAEQLTPHQREVLVAITLNGVPIDVLADRLNTTRGALYKTLHDARQKLRAHLADRGMAVGADEPGEG